MTIEDRYDEVLSEMYDQIDEAIKASGQEHSLVIYSAYGEVDDLPVNNLNEIAYKGTFIVSNEYSDFWDGRSGFIGDTPNPTGGEDYKSVEITDPTWLTLSVLANQSIITTNDLHHVFLEGVVVHGNELKLSFGS